jgi:hypothetical protein
MSVPDEQQSPPEELLARALESLSSEDRQQVTMWLLSTMSGGGQPGWPGKPERDPLPRVWSGSTGLRELYGQHQFSAMLGAGGQGHQVVPVRLPAELHARLRTWSSGHGFSMATVVRGLVARFLDGQEAVAEGVVAEPES